jgi:hypothetical protein
MKSKILIIAAIVLLIIIVAGVWFYLNKTENSNISPEANQNNENQEEGKMLVKDDFSIILPQGWAESPAAVEGVSALAYNTQESLTDKPANDIGFVSYFSVAPDVLGDYDMAGYKEYAKESLQAVLGSVQYSNEQKFSINNKEAYAIEMDLNQESVDFKVLMFFIKGNNNDVWTLSFNTVASAWNDYKDSFYQSVESFIVKIK